MEDDRALGDRARVTPARRALVLARGAGRRMQAADEHAALTPEQQAAASTGQKAFMPIAGRPFLDHVVDVLRSAGIDDVCVVRGPDQDVPGKLVTVVQQDARGTADAVLAARDWTAGESFLVLNGDNLYPVVAIESVAALDGPGLAGFDRDDLVATSNIPPERIGAFALLERDPAGDLRRIVEKPTAADVESLAAPLLVSMNLWKFDARIFDACRDVQPSARGEFELPSAVMLARERGVTFAVVPSVGPVLDLSRRADIAEVSRRLSGAAQ
jgi:dTDP-glucose pyrophosphorylase